MKAVLFREAWRARGAAFGRGAGPGRRARQKSSSTFTPPVSTRPITRCGWAAAYQHRWRPAPTHPRPRLFGRGQRARPGSDFRSATRCSGSAIRASRAPTPKRSRSSPRSSPRSRRGLAMPRRRRWPDEPHRAVGARGHGEAQTRRSHPDSGRRRRRRRLCDPACQASRRHGDHDRQRRQPRLCSPPRRRPGDRLHQEDFSQGGF